jgi:hypothetical protein
MVVNKAYKATLALGKNETLKVLKTEAVASTEIDKGKFYVDSTLKVASKMKATLRDINREAQKNFEIQLMGDAEQEIDSVYNKAFWEWSIVPLKSGQHTLELIVEIVKEGNKKRFLPSKTIPIIIFSKPLTDNVSSFFAKNWQWMISAVMIPLLIAWLNLRNRNKAAPAVKRKRK